MGRPSSAAAVADDTLGKTSCRAAHGAHMARRNSRSAPSVISPCGPAAAVSVAAQASVVCCGAALISERRARARGINSSPAVDAARRDTLRRAGSVDSSRRRQKRRGSNERGRRRKTGQLSLRRRSRADLGVPAASAEVRRGPAATRCSYTDHWRSSRPTSARNERSRQRRAEAIRGDPTWPGQSAAVRCRRSQEVRRSEVVGGCQKMSKVATNGLKW